MSKKEGTIISLKSTDTEADEDTEQMLELGQRQIINQSNELLWSRNSEKSNHNGSKAELVGRKPLYCL